MPIMGALIGGLVDRADGAQSGAAPGSDAGIVGFGILLGGGLVDLRLELGRFGENADALLGHRQEPAVDRDPQVLFSSRSTRTMASSTNWATNGMWRGRMPISPTVVRVNRNFAVPDQMFRSTATISTFNSAMPQLPSQLGAETLGFLGQVIKATDQEEGLFGYVIEIALAQAVERFNGLLHRDGRTRLAGELFGCHHVLR